MEKTILHNKKVWITSDGWMDVYDHRLATKLNGYFHRYLTEGGQLYKFKKGEEAKFKFHPSEELRLILEHYLDCPEVFIDGLGV